MLISTEAIFIAEALSSYNSSILIHRKTGEVLTIEPSISLRGFEEYMYYGKASGDFSKEDWGVSFNDETGKYEVKDNEGAVMTTCEDEEIALEKAVKIFGIPAEIHDEINDKVNTLL